MGRVFEAVRDIPALRLVGSSLTGFAGDFDWVLSRIEQDESYTA
jgi:hypothetical protein